MSDQQKTYLSTNLEFFDDSSYGFVTFTNASGSRALALGGGVKDDYIALNMSNVSNLYISGGNLNLDTAVSIQFVAGTDKTLSGSIIPSLDVSKYSKSDGTAWGITNKPLAINSIDSIAFVNSKTNRLVGLMNMATEVFTWDGGFSLGSAATDTYFETFRSTSGKVNMSVDSKTYNAEIGFKLAGVMQYKIGVDVVSNDFYIGDFVKITKLGDLLYKGTRLEDLFMAKTDAYLKSAVYTKAEIDALLLGYTKIS
jgi:hypothetical protein